MSIDKVVFSLILLFGCSRHSSTSSLHPPTKDAAAQRSCYGWDHRAAFPDALLPDGLCQAEHGISLSDENIYAPIRIINPQLTNGSIGMILYQHGGDWTLEKLPQGVTYAWIHEVTVADVDHIYAVGAKYAGFLYTSTILEKQDDGPWQEMKSFSMEYPDIRSIWCAAPDDCFVSTNHCTDATTCDHQIWRGHESTWERMR